MFDNDALLNETVKLRKFACRLTGNLPDAEDLVQSTIMRALEKKHLFEPGTNLFGWSSKILFNIFVTQYRRKSRFETQYDPESYMETVGVPANQETKMEWQNVQDAMNRISEDHREILIMICIEGMQYAEVSQMLKIPVGTVRSRLSRARESLQAALDKPANGSVRAPSLVSARADSSAMVMAA